MHVVLDTNVVVSGLLSETGAPGWILDLALAGELELSLDDRILAEYREVLLRPELALPEGAVQEFLGAIERLARRVTARPWPQALPDPDDEPFLTVAGAAGAVLVTGNLRHFPAAKRGGVQVLSPREFLDLLRAVDREEIEARAEARAESRAEYFSASEEE